jgi:precorrin-6Y C5,15-methyltransferase (decarboxylating)
VVSIEGERAVLDWHSRHGGELTRIAISRAESLGAHHAWRPLMPVTQLFAAKSV